MFNIFNRKRYTGHDCHYCDTPIREHVNQAIVLQGRYALRTICSPCYDTHRDTIADQKIVDTRVHPDADAHPYNIHKVTL